MLPGGPGAAFWGDALPPHAPNHCHTINDFSLHSCSEHPGSLLQSFPQSCSHRYSPSAKCKNNWKYIIRVDALRI